MSKGQCDLNYKLADFFIRQLMNLMRGATLIFSQLNLTDKNRFSCFSANTILKLYVAKKWVKLFLVSQYSILSSE